MGGRLRQVGWRGGNTSSSEGTSSWWLPMAYLQPAANTLTQITSMQRLGKGNGLQSEYLILIRLLAEQTGILLAIIFFISVFLDK
jgi:hypothetical protein